MLHSTFFDWDESYLREGKKSIQEREDKNDNEFHLLFLLNSFYDMKNLKKAIISILSGFHLLFWLFLIHSMYSNFGEVA